MTVPGWGSDFDYTRQAGGGQASIAVTLAATPTDDEMIVLFWACGDATEAEPVWPSGFTLGGQNNSHPTHKEHAGFWAWKIADSESGATYTVTPDGGGNFPSEDTVLGGLILDTVNAAAPVGFYDCFDPQGSTGSMRLGPLDVPYTDTMTLAVGLNLGTSPLQATEMDAAFTSAGDGSLRVGYKTQTGALVEPVYRMQDGNLAVVWHLITIRGSGSVLDSASYLGDLYDGGSEYDTDLEAGFTDGSTLDSHTGWDGYSLSGSGRITIDGHLDHRLGQVGDMSTTGYEFVVRNTQMSSVDQWGGVAFFADTDRGHPSNYNYGCILLRLEDATADSGMRGYLVRLERRLGDTGSGQNNVYLRIFRVDSPASQGQLASSADLGADFKDQTDTPPRNEAARIHASIDGDVITGYVDGVQVVSYDIGGDGTVFDDGDYMGVGEQRGYGGTYSQPWIDCPRFGVMPSGAENKSTTGSTSLALAASGTVAKAGDATGTGSLTLAASGTVAKAGDTTGTTALALLAAADRGDKTASTTGAGALALAASGTVVKGDSKSTTGATSLALSAPADATKAGDATGATNVALGATGAASKVGSTTGATALALAGVGTPTSKTAAATAATSITLAAAGTVGTTSDKSTTGATSLSFGASGNVVKTGDVSASTSLGLAAAADAEKTGDTTGTSQLALGAAGTAAKTASATGATSITLNANGIAGAYESKSATGATSITLAASGSVIKIGAPYGTATIALATPGSVVKSGATDGDAPLTLATVGDPVKTTGVAGATSLTIDESAVPAKVVAAVGAASLTFVGVGGVMVGDGSYRPDPSRTLNVSEHRRVLWVGRRKRTIHIGTTKEEIERWP